MTSRTMAPSLTVHLLDSQPAEAAETSLIARCELESARHCYARRIWADAYQLLAVADAQSGLDGPDLECFATSAYLIGRDEECQQVLDRAHRAYLDVGEWRGAVRCAFWLWLGALSRGDLGQASGWLARAQRLLEGEQCDCVEQGYLLCALAQHQAIAGDLELAHATASRALDIAARFREADLSVNARHMLGRIRLQQERVAEGLALLDEAMLAVVSGEVSPRMTGLIYCSVIEACLRVYALSRACEWTGALARWCGEQPQMVAFTGTCLLHRAEILQMQGAWSEAFQDALRATERCLQAGNRRVAAGAFYQQAEIHRLRGDFAAAEEAYRSASQWGWDPQPGLALLRAAQGQLDAASSATRRALGATADPPERVRLLAAHVEIMLAAGEIQEACDACGELAKIAQRLDAETLNAIAAQARGAVNLAQGNARGALTALGCALQIWQRAGAPRMAACVLVRVALACRTLGDYDGYELGLSAARSSFEELGARPDIERLEALTRGLSPDRPGRLTRRELQVLRLVAVGKTNREIGSQLHLSKKTIDRHVSNIFNKLDVSTRTAATAYVYQRRLFDSNPVSG